MSNIVIAGEISQWGYGAKWLRGELDAGTGPRTVEVSSYGGDVYESIDMYNLLRQYSKTKGEITIIVGAKAMSGGAIITMAGDKRIAHANSTFMIHRAWTFTWGNAVDLMDEAKILEGIDKIQAKEFAKYLNESEDEVLEMFTKDTYYVGKEELESTNIFTEILEEPLESDIETKKQASNGFASAKKDFVAQVEKNNYVPDFAKVAKVIDEVEILATMPSDDEKIVNQIKGEGMEYNEENFNILTEQNKVFTARITTLNSRVANLTDDNTALQTSLDAKTTELKGMSDKLSEAKKEAKVEVAARLTEANASNVTSIDTMIAMVNADTEEDASKIAIDASKSESLKQTETKVSSKPWDDFLPKGAK